MQIVFSDARVLLVAAAVGVAALTLLVVLLPRLSLRARWQRGRERRRRALVEDALKYIHAAELRGAAASPESLAGRLRLRVAPTFELIAEMEAHGPGRPVPVSRSPRTARRSPCASSGRIVSLNGISRTNCRCLWKPSTPPPTGANTG